MSKRMLEQLNFKLQNALLIVVASLFPCASLPSDVVVVTDSSWGQGSFRQRGNECLIITPRHVVEEAFDIHIVLPDGSQFDAEIVELFESDIAVLRAKVNDAVICTGNWITNNEYRKLLELETSGVIKLRKQNGARQNIPVSIFGFDSFRSIQIRALDERNAFKQGFSGSILYLRDEPSGMLLTVHDGTGHILQLQTLDSILSPFFEATNNHKTVFLNLSPQGEFMRAKLEELTNLSNIQLASTADANYELIVDVETERHDLETDKLAHFRVKIMLTDATGASHFDEEITVTGNSFISINRAEKNGEKHVRSAIFELGIFDAL